MSWSSWAKNPLNLSESVQSWVGINLPHFAAVDEAYPRKQKPFFFGRKLDDPPDAPKSIAVRCWCRRPAYPVVPSGRKAYNESRLFHARALKNSPGSTDVSHCNLCSWASLAAPAMKKPGIRHVQPPKHGQKRHFGELHSQKMDMFHEQCSKPLASFPLILVMNRIASSVSTITENGQAC